MFLDKCDMIWAEEICIKKYDTIFELCNNTGYIHTYIFRFIVRITISPEKKKKKSPEHKLEPKIEYF